MTESTMAFMGQDLLVLRDQAGPPALGLEPLFVEGLTERSRRSFAWEDRNWTALSLAEEEAAAAEARGLARLPLRQALGELPAGAVRPALKGLALLNWLEGARHCGACGAALVDAVGGGEGVGEDGGRVCTACGRAHFPRISPAVIVLVLKEGKALLGRNSRWGAGVRFSLLAGFVEPGESLEEAAIREVREESGVEIGRLAYRRSQPWPFPDSLMLAFTAEWISGEPKPDGEEIVELRWCSPDDLPPIPPPGSVARYLLDEWRSGRL